MVVVCIVFFCLFILKFIFLNIKRFGLIFFGDIEMVGVDGRFRFVFLTVVRKELSVVCVFVIFGVVYFPS